MQGRRSSCVLHKVVREPLVTAMEGHIKLTWNYLSSACVRLCVCVNVSAYIAHSIKVHKLCSFRDREEEDDDDLEK